MESPALRRLRRFEFEQALSVHAWRLGFARTGVRWQRLLLGGWVVIAAIMGWLMVSGFRGHEVAWADNWEWGGAGALALVAVAWLGWGLGGVIQLVATLQAGNAWGERLGGRRVATAPVEQNKPLLELLPLSDGQVTRAKLEGRLAAWLVAVVISMIPSLLPMLLLAPLGLIKHLPPPVDPWLEGCAVVLVALLVASRHGAVVARRVSPHAGQVRMVVLILSAVGAAYADVLLALNQSREPTFPEAAGVGLAVVLLGVALYSRPRRPAGAGRASAAAEGSPAGRARGFMTADLTTRPLALVWPPAATDQPWGRLVRQHLRRSASFVGAFTGMGLVVEFMVWVSVLLWGQAHSLSVAGTYQATGQTPFYVGPGLALLGAVVGVVMAGQMVWPEYGVSRRGRRDQFAPVQYRHGGFLLPQAARDRWRRGFALYWAWSLPLLPLGAAAFLLVWAEGRLLTGLALPWLVPLPYLGLALSPLLGLLMFSLLPLQQHLARNLPLTGCLVMATVILGLIPGELLAIQWSGAYSRLGQPPPWGVVVALAAWVALALGLSWWWVEPTVWRRDRTGGPDTNSRLRGVAVLLMMLLSMGLAIAVGMTAMGFLA